MQTLRSVVGGLLFVAFMLVVMTGRGKGLVYSLLWDGKSTLTCGGDFVMKIKGRTIKTTVSPLFEAGGDCRLEIVDCDIEAPVVIGGGGTAHVTVSGGRLRGTQRAIDIGGAMVVDLVGGARIEGPVHAGAEAKVNGLEALDPKAAKAAAREMLSSRFGKHACDGALACFLDHHFAGQGQAHVVGAVDATGKVGHVEVVTPASPAIRACLSAAMQVQTIADFDGQPGQLTCDIAGMFAGPTRMVTQSGGFER